MAGAPHNTNVVTTTIYVGGVVYEYITSGLGIVTPADISSPNKPRAFINVIFFTEQFKSYDYHVSMVGANSELKDHFFELQNLAVNKSGYVYIYCSNESNVNVYFDNLQVIHTRGPLLETNEYYPFGLLASAISYKASNSMENNIKLSGNERQSGEFADGSGLELYDFNARMYEAQTGRFNSVDPLAVMMPEWSPYSFSFNNPVNFIDPLGLEPYDYNPQGDPEDYVDYGDWYNWDQPGFPGIYENDQSTQKETLDNVTLFSFKGFNLNNFDTLMRIEIFLTVMRKGIMNYTGKEVEGSQTGEPTQ